jgi:hypothetical protein
VLSFHTTVHVRSPQVQEGTEADLPAGRFRTLAAPHEALAIPFGLSFEDAGKSLELLERMYFEPDGSFVWTSAGAGSPWQVEGNLFDRAGRLLFADLKGSCPNDQFDRLLSAFGWPGTPLMFQLVHEAVFLAEAEFRRYAAVRRATEDKPRG